MRLPSRGTLLALIGLVLSGCAGLGESTATPGSSDAEATRGKVHPAMPGSEVLREVELSSVENGYPDENDEDCPGQWTAYGTSIAIGEVVAWFESQGFAGHGAGPNGRLMRWWGSATARRRRGGRWTWRRATSSVRRSGRPATR